VSWSWPPPGKVFLARGLNARYAAAHARARQALAGVITDLYRRAGQLPPSPAEQMAQLILTIEAGIRLEQAADPEGSADSAAFDRLRRFPESPALPGDEVDGARRPT
jgi:hypothetical protein